jgi:hypothetical protein
VSLHRCLEIDQPSNQFSAATDLISHHRNRDSKHPGLESSTKSIDEKSVFRDLKAIVPYDVRPPRRCYFFRMMDEGGEIMLYVLASRVV